MLRGLPEFQSAEDVERHTAAVHCAVLLLDHRRSVLREERIAFVCGLGEPREEVVEDAIELLEKIEREEGRDLSELDACRASEYSAFLCSRVLSERERICPADKALGKRLWREMDDSSSGLMPVARGKIPFEGQGERGIPAGRGPLLGETESPMPCGSAMGWNPCEADREGSPLGMEKEMMSCEAEKSIDCGFDLILRGGIASPEDLQHWRGQTVEVQTTEKGEYHSHSGMLVEAKEDGIIVTGGTSEAETFVPYHCIKSVEVV